MTTVHTHVRSKNPPANAGCSVRWPSRVHLVWQTFSCPTARLVWTAQSHSSSRMRLRLRKGPHPAVTEHHARLLQDAHPSGISPIRSLDESCRLMHRRPRKHYWRHPTNGFAFKLSQSRNRSAICILTSYAFRQNDYCPITVLKCRPMKLIPACRTPQVSLPNMASLFLSRKIRRQDIISSIFHNLQLYSKVSVAGCFHAWIASADTPLQKTRHVLRKAHFAVRGRHTRPPFLAQPTSYNQPPRAPA